MRQRSIIWAAVVLSSAAMAQAAIFQTASPYTDAQGDQVGSTNKDRDIWSVTITNDLTNLYFTINLNPTADLSAGGSFDYGIGITTGSPTAGGDTSANATTHGNAYHRSISIDSSLGGMTDWIGLYPFPNTGGNTTNPNTSYGFNDFVFGTPNSTTPAGVWTQSENVSNGVPISTQGTNTTNSSISLTVPMSDFSANLSLTPGTTFDFDVFSTGTSSGNAYDSLADQTATNSTNSGTTQYNGTVLDSYTIVPEPASTCIMAMGGIALAASRKRRA